MDSCRPTRSTTSPIHRSRRTSFTRRRRSSFVGGHASTTSSVAGRTGAGWRFDCSLPGSKCWGSRPSSLVEPGSQECRTRRRVVAKWRGAQSTGTSTTWEPVGLRRWPTPPWPDALREFARPSLHTAAAGRSRFRPRPSHSTLLQRKEQRRAHGEFQRPVDSEGERFARRTTEASRQLSDAAIKASSRF